MKKILILCAVLFGAVLAHADNNVWDTAKKKEAGRLIETQSVTCTTFTATALGTSTRFNAVIDYFNNSAYTMWVGSNTTTLQTTGFPVLSSTTYTTDGMYTGDLYCMGDSAAAGNTNARVMRWMMQ